MATKKKMLQAAAGSAGGAGLNVEEVFSTYLYTGDASARSITNGIDLDGEGGLVWIKDRSVARNHCLTDTERGAYSSLATNLTSQKRGANTVTNFSSSGFTVAHDTSDAVFANTTNASGETYASWTFRKAPKFFDVVTYTGDGTSNRQIAHNIGGTVGFILIKRYDSTGNWLAWHRQVDPGYGILDLTLAFEAGANGFLNDVTDTYFETSWLNTSGATYVAYLFAHNDDDGGFGPDGDADIIKCGSYTGNGSNNGPTINLGFEPQWLMVKNVQNTGGWVISDNMRGFNVTASQNLQADEAIPETQADIGHWAEPTPTGFKITNSSAYSNQGSTKYIYMAIRRGPMAVPEDATEVFEPAITYDENNDPGFNSGFVTDMFLWRQPQRSDEFRFFTRLNQGQSLRFDNSLGENANAGQPFDFSDGVDAPTNDNARGWLWKRAPQFCDVVCYTGTGSNQNVSHNLGVAPEMMWVKRRDNTDMWNMYHSNLGNTQYIRMDGSYDGTNTPVTSSTTWNNTTPSDTTFTVGTRSDVNGYGNTYIATLFASLDGISKVGSYTGNGSSQTIDCGFTAGARFVLIKNISFSNSNWFVFDTVRGIVSGNDNTLYLNSTASQITNEDCIDPHSSGFRVTNSNGYVDTNNSNQNYIFYAIA